MVLLFVPADLLKGKNIQKRSKCLVRLLPNMEQKNRNTCKSQYIDGEPFYCQGKNPGHFKSQGALTKEDGRSGPERKLKKIFIRLD